jgi:16S rRNA processing protein RimM
LTGEVGVSATTNRDERFTPGSVLYAGGRALVVSSARRHGGRWLVRFGGVDDRTAAESLQGVTLTGDPLDTLADDEHWVHETIGRDVLDRDGRVLGHVVAVEANPAHDLLVLDDGTLVPMVFVVDDDTRGLVVDPPEGLLDVNRRDAR